MDIPKDLIDLTDEHYEALDVLLQDQCKGVIVARVSMLEFQLEETLVFYFCERSRQAEFADLILRKLGFDAKVTTLAKLVLNDKSKELRDKIIAAIRPMQQLRNKAAHNAGVKRTELIELLKDKSKRPLLISFPQGFEQAASDIQAWLEELIKQPGFCIGPN